MPNVGQIQANNRSLPVSALDRQQLRVGAERLQVTLSDDQLDLLEHFAAMVVKWNAQINLISRRDIDRLQARHILDSLAVVPWLTGPTILDVGSGAGLPGIPVAIACPDRALTLCERMTRRARFLNQAVQSLELDNVEIVPRDVSEVSTKYDTVTARAVASPMHIWRDVEQKLVAGGRVLVFASTQGRGGLVEDREDEANLASHVQVTYHHYQVPGLERRHTIIELQGGN
jgi:16S rRNA (guanine527-N7)-methyltransferase